MKRILPFLLAAPIAVYAFACSSSSDNSTNTSNPDGGATGTTNPDGGGVDNTGDSGAIVTAESNINPTTGVTVSIFSTPGAAAHGMTWIPAQKAFYAALPTSTTDFDAVPGVPTVGKIVRIEADGNTSYEILAGTAATGAMFSAAFNAKSNKVMLIGTDQILTIDPTTKAVSQGTVFATNSTGLASDDAGTGATPLQGMNDIVVKKDGSAYVTAPWYPGSGTEMQPANAFHRVYFVKADGSVEAVAHYENNERPNGIVLSPDEKKLFVSLTDPTTLNPGRNLPSYGEYPAIWQYPINADGSLGLGSKFAQVGTTKAVDQTTKPDGMVTDISGNIYVATIQGVVVFKPNGDVWGTIPVAEQTASLAWGGDDLKTLYIGASNDPPPDGQPATANKGNIYKVAMQVTGIVR